MLLPSGIVDDGGPVLPGVIRQVGYVVTDLDASLAGWVGLGVGPWYVIRALPQRVTYRGRPCELTISIALANSGDLQLELIQQLDDTPSIFTEFLDSGGQGFHQLAYWTADFDASMAKVQTAGWPVVWSGGADVGTRFAYVEPPGSPAAVIEIMELTEATEGMAIFLRDAAEGWDGRDPVRELGG
ncbi:VOC family protein [Mycobacterium sp. Y57]|nr:VOC family protein [Mycolicibacterium xanthum]